MIHGGLPELLTDVCAKTVGLAVALLSGLLLSSASSSVSSSSLSIVAFILLWSLVRLVLVVVVM